jgi:hypothetical protein
MEVHPVLDEGVNVHDPLEPTVVMRIVNVWPGTPAGNVPVENPVLAEAAIAFLTNE